MSLQDTSAGGIKINNGSGSGNVTMLTSGGRLGVGVASPAALFDKSTLTNDIAAQYERVTGMAHGVTSWYPTDVYFAIDTYNAGTGRTCGGAKLTGLTSDTLTPGFTIDGVLPSSGATKSAILLNGAKANSTVTQALAATEKIISFTNNSSERASIFANGDIRITNSGAGFVLQSPNGHYWRVTVDNSGYTATTDLGT
jgi:hypothetical protein